MHIAYRYSYRYSYQVSHGFHSRYCVHRTLFAVAYLFPFPLTSSILLIILNRIFLCNPKRRKTATLPFHAKQQSFNVIITRMDYFFLVFSSSVTSIGRILFVRISSQISLINTERAFWPSSPAKRLLTETLPSSSSFAPTTSI